MERAVMSVRVVERVVKVVVHGAGSVGVDEERGEGARVGWDTARVAKRVVGVGAGGGIDGKAREGRGGGWRGR